MVSGSGDRSPPARPNPTASPATSSAGPELLSPVPALPLQELPLLGRILDGSAGPGTWLRRVAGAGPDPPGKERRCDTATRPPCPPHALCSAGASRVTPLGPRQ